MAEETAYSQTAKYTENGVTYSAKLCVKWDPSVPASAAYSKFCVEYWKTGSTSTSQMPYLQISASDKSPWYRTTPSPVVSKLYVIYPNVGGGDPGTTYDIVADVNIAVGTTPTEYWWELTLKVWKGKKIVTEWPPGQELIEYLKVGFGEGEGHGECRVKKVPH